METEHSSIDFTINGKDYFVAAAAGDTTLLECLRKTLCLTAAKNGCGEGHCGACTVIIDGKAELACLKRLKDLQGKKVVTLEHLSTTEYLDPLQYAFIKEGAIQCGFCTPGMIMAAKALLAGNPDPCEDEIKKALAGNICRCTGYVKIIRAVQRAAALLREGRRQIKIEEIYPDSACKVGDPAPRVDGLQKATGTLKFADDLFFEGMLYTKVLRSDYAHALVLEVDTSAALIAEGVAAVLTAEDVPGDNSFGIIIADQPVFAHKKVRFVGDPLAAVYAESEKAAEQALSLIKVKYRELPVISSPQEALAPGAPLLHDNNKESNIFSHMESGRGDVAKGFEEADIILEADYTTPFIEHGYLEPESGIAVAAKDGGVSVYVGSQGPPDDIKQMAVALNLPPEKIHIAHRPMGGGFGGREDITVQIIAALGALKTGRPVKYTFTRRESIRASVKRHAHYLHYKTGITGEGKITAVKAQIYSDSGAYASAGEAIILRAVSFGAGPYTLSNAEIDGYAVYTNNVPAGAMRGFGNPPVTFASEVQLNRLAEKLKLDPIDIRLKNILEEGLPTITGERIRYSVGAKACLLAVKEALSGTELPEPEAGWKLGIGVASSYKNVGLGIGMDDSGGAYGEITGEGFLVVRVGSVDMGQGSDTTMAQIASTVLGWPFSRIIVQSADSKRDPWGGMTTASRQTFVTGNAVYHMALALKEKISGYLAARYKLDADNIGIEGLAFVEKMEKGTSRELISIADFAKKSNDRGEKIFAEYRYAAPETHFSLKEPSGGYQSGKERLHAAYCFAAQAVILQVNEKSGQVKVFKVIAASDTGKVVNPQAVEGQMEGGVVMGLGYALSEEFKLDHGRIVTDTMAKLGLPRIHQIPEIECIMIENPHAEGPFGAKGMSELPISMAAPAVVSAIHDALGIWLTSIPATPDKILRALKSFP